MGNVPYCFNCEQEKQLIKGSEVIIDDDSNEFSNLKYKEIKSNQDFILNRKLELDTNKNTLSPQIDFINPLPNIVILKPRRI